MKAWCGIDLGSTTTKAVLLDRAGAILGRGITNSRSNYDVAAAAARSEASIDARFGLVRRALAADGALGTGEKLEECLRALDRAFRLGQHRAGLARLDERVRAEAARGGGRVKPAVLDDLFESMQAEAKRTFLFGGPRKSDFFRDLAGSHFQAAAERLSRREGLAFETLMALYDKSILAVENEPLDVAFAASIERAFAQSLDRAGIGAGEIRARLERILADAAETPLEVVRTIGTGYGRQRLPFAREDIRSEILCHGLGAHAMFPRTATVLDIGGQDTKAIQVDPDGIVTSFQMNDRCAAGCGRYLGYIADEMSLGLHELGPLALEARSPVRINSTCTVFAGAELRDRLTLGEKREDILAGLHRAIVLRAMSLLARSGGIRDEFTFTGGVARNPAAVQALETLVRENYGERTLNISPDSIYTGAIGAALFALRDAAGTEAAA